MLIKNAKSVKLMERKKDFFKQHYLEWKDVFSSLLEICVDKDFYVEWMNKYDMFDVTFFSL